ncbi:zinc transporter [Pseudorhodobacter turbinis]|uniref:High-affinity zinc uptake system protein ZnuA n=1 Tax=Pseudorhodobacter turbinis TaxID=2500533 RepID=A0A4V1E0M4_9RHOB|nr:zinc ABC transporter substrate-binding protein [Pseudorhodobacter turbinis]QCO55144.1 zinc transporter [Pseudorhodobacter turbinis]
MSRSLLPVSLAFALIGSTALAQAPRVATDIAPIHSLVARVMDGVGTPDLIVQPGASPHEYALRPSEASALQEADLVFWVGAGLSPWLETAMTTLAVDASVTELSETNGTTILEARVGALFEKHAHGAETHDDAEHHDHDDHGGHDDHDHGKQDSHAWLSPQNASNWLNVIAAQLSAADPDNAGTYFANAAAGRTELATLTSDVNAMLEPVRSGRFIVFHDAYQYFENDFNFPASGAISVSDASDPSPSRIAEIRERITTEGIDCVLAEPQFNPGLVATVLEGSDAKTAVIDPLGSDLEIGPALYPQMIRNLASNLAGCL